MNDVHQHKYLIVIAGPTAVGKTSTAIQIAQQLQTEIISADSRQIFKELKIGVARPNDAELALIKHHCIAHKSIANYYSAGAYEQEVIAILNELFKTKKYVVLCGGTGFYINAVLYGLDDIPKVDEKIRPKLNQLFLEKGIEYLQAMLKEIDEASYQSIDIKNTQRVIRALEVTIGSGKKFSTFKSKKITERDFIPIKIGLQLSKEQLHSNINNRVDSMMQQGFLQEAKNVLEYSTHNALQTVGYNELFDFLDGKTTLEEAVDLIKLHTRQYAKRQLTFFNKNNAYTWFNPNQIEDIMSFIQQQST